MKQVSSLFVGSIILIGIGLVSLKTSEPSQFSDTVLETQSANWGRRLKKRTKSKDECKLRRALPASKNVKPAFVAAYPGSGSSLVRTLIPYLTGIKATSATLIKSGDEIDAIAIKTHYPHKSYLGFVDWAEKIKRAVLLIRNPMSAIPSFCNFQNEKDEGLGIHSVQASTEKWIEWRDRKFTEELGRWVQIVQYWMDNEEIEDKFVLSYEDLTGEYSGAETSVRLTEFLGRSPDVQAVSVEAIPCVWRKVVKYDDPSTRKGLDHGTKRTNRQEREFTEEQMMAMLTMIKKLALKYSHKSDLVKVLDRYTLEINMKYHQKHAELSRKST